jgi:carbamoyl-phosphate synthase large subunit
MPKRTDIHTILIPGSGPIVIGQAAEFDYSGTQAVKALRKEGYRTVLVNSNPATIMTDPDLADATYVEPLTVEALEAIIAQERPDAMLPTVGGQTGLNLALALSESGVLQRYGVRLIGASLDAIRAAEDRDLFRRTLLAHDLPAPRGGPAFSLREAQALTPETGYPLLVRASFALGGSGASWVYTPDQLPEAVRKAIAASPIGQAWVEESVLGWKEYELEVMRDAADNFVVVCSIENLDPMGVHTGDSITVAPAQTLTDREYQVLRDLARRVMSAVGVETGGSNVQFGVDPATGRVLIIEMNPRVSRSSSLASKATGFPIAKIAALVAAGYTLDEIPNDITGETQAAFEPSLDYVVVKIPRWAFEKFPGVDPLLGPQMKSVGEAMALGRTFPEALNKAVQSLETGVDALDGSGPKRAAPAEPPAIEELRRPTADRLYKAYRAVRGGLPLSAIATATGYDPWFVAQMQEIVATERKVEGWASEAGLGLQVEGSTPADRDELRRVLWEAKRQGFSDSHLARLLGATANPSSIEPAGLAGNLQSETDNLQPSTPGQLRWLNLQPLRAIRRELGIAPTFQRVDTCAAEFHANTPYLYSAYEMADEAQPGDRPKVLILGSGPNRIGQGIEFDYCCCQAAFALKQLGYESIMLNCNPETVSTDYDTADRLYFEPLTLEHVLNVVECERPIGVIVQFGGQTPLNLAEGLEQAGVPILGTSPAAIRLAEDRERFASLLADLDIPQPEHGIACTLEDARQIAEQIGYPVLVRPSYVLGGRAMAIVGGPEQLEGVAQAALEAAPGAPLLVDRFMEDAFEIDCDALADGERVVIGAIMQHIEEAGVHSGDSACVLPPYKVSQYHLNIIREYTERLGLALGVRGLMNVQYAIKDDIVYVLEANPRASRTVPYASKATGLNLARAAAQVMVGKTLAELGLLDEPAIDGFFVKEAVLPFKKLPGSDALLGPEMRSTGEVMGHAARFGHAFAKSQIAAGARLPMTGAALISVNDFDKGAALKIARDLHRMGFRLIATPGTAAFFSRAGLPVGYINKFRQGSPHTVDLIRAGQVQLILNTPLGPETHSDGAEIRAAAIAMDVPLLTTLSAAVAAVSAIRALQQKELKYRSLQDHYAAQKERGNKRLV